MKYNTKLMAVLKLKKYMPDDGNQSFLTDSLVPLYFFLVAFSWPIQVLFGAPWISFFFFLPILMFSIVHLKRILGLKIEHWQDAVVVCMVILIGVHAVISVIADPANLIEHCKGFFVVACGALVYFLAFRILSLRSTNFILMAISIAAVVISLQWIYDSYVRTVLHQESWYYKKVLAYIIRRNGFQYSDINWSVVGTQYRSYGLLDKHTTTGAYVALGAICGFSIIRNRMESILVLLFLALTVLFIGGATSAFLTASIVLSLVSVWTLLRIKQNKVGASEVFSAAFKVFITWIIFISTVILFSVFDRNLGSLFLDRSKLFHMQLSFLTNFNSVPYSTEIGDLTVSMPNIVSSGIYHFIEFASKDATFALFGQGLSPRYQLFATGGDLGVVDLLATFGLPLSALFFVMVFYLLYKSIAILFCSRLGAVGSALLVFGSASVIFLAVTQMHYDIIMKKEILPILFLSLGLMRRYSEDTNRG